MIEAYEAILERIYRKRVPQPAPQKGGRIDVIACARNGIPFAFITQDMVYIPREYWNRAKLCGAMVEV